MARNRFCCCCLPGCAAILLIPSILAGYVFMAATQRPDEFAPAKHYTPMEKKEARERIADVKKAMETARAEARRNRRKPFEWSVSEDDLNANLASDPEIRSRLEERGVDDLRIDFVDGGAKLQGSVAVGSRRLWVLSDGKIRAGQKGAIYFVPGQIRLGRLNWNLPEAAREQIFASMKEQSQDPVYRVPGEIQELKVTDDRLIVRGRTDPTAIRGMEIHKNDLRTDGKPSSEKAPP